MSKRLGLLLLLVTSCADSSPMHPPPNPVGLPCNVDDDCEGNGYICVAGVCDGDTRPFDGGGRDTRPIRVDAGPRPDSGRRDAALPDAGNDAGPDSGAWASGDVLIGVFPAELGVWVVTVEHALLLDADGSTIHTFNPGRVITAATFDGERLIVADRVGLSLIEGTEVTDTVSIREWCGNVYPLSGNRLLCGRGFPERGREYVVIDLLIGYELSRATTRFSSRTLEQVGNEDRFIGHRDPASTSSSELYEVVGNELTFVAQSARVDHLGKIMGFVGSPVTHMVTRDGIYLSLHADRCRPAAPSEDCFQRDGDLGVVPTDQRYLAMRSHEGRMYGLLSRDFFRCEDGCSLQEVDIEAARVLRTWSFTATFMFNFGLTVDSHRQRVLFAFATSHGRPDETFEIHTFSLEPDEI